MRVDAERRFQRRKNRATQRLASSGSEAEQAEADEATAELTASYWRAYDERMASTSFLAMARQFPSLVAQAIRLGFEASRRDLVATIGLNLISGFFTGYALLATTGVLSALFAAGPTPDRVRAALPSLVLVAGAVAARSGLQTAASWAQSRLQRGAPRAAGGSRRGGRR
jgi:ATP-binding cassette subfamily B protein